jgi:hypothetical protein
MVGLVIGLARFILEIASGTVLCNEVDTRPAILTKVRLQWPVLALICSGSLLALWTVPIRVRDNSRYCCESTHAGG